MVNVPKNNSHYIYISLWPEKVIRLKIWFSIDLPIIMANVIFLQYFSKPLRPLARFALHWVYYFFKFKYIFCLMLR